MHAALGLSIMNYSIIKSTSHIITYLVGDFAIACTLYAVEAKRDNTLNVEEGPPVRMISWCGCHRAIVRSLGLLLLFL